MVLWAVRGVVGSLPTAANVTDVGTGGKVRRTWPQRLLVGFNALLVVACLAAAGALYTFSEKLSSVETIAIDSATAAPLDPGETRNILIVGTDSAENLDENDPVNVGRAGENLADVIMIMRIDPEAGTARLLSIPRDTRVALSPTGNMGKINGLLTGVDGPRNLINTIRRNFGISIDNYVQVDFAGFKDLVGQLGGVPVYFAAPVRDKNSGLHVGEAGCVLLGPDEALAYARARHFQYQDDDGRWRYDQTGDLGRITRQQDFIKRAMRRASEAGMRNPGTAIGIVDAGVDAVKIDDTLTTGMIMELVSVFRTFNPDELETQQIPTAGSMRGGVSFQEVVWDETVPMLLAYWGFDGDGKLNPGDIVVDVKGARSASDAADLLTMALDTAGFDAEVDSARYTPKVTTITFGDAGFHAALTLAGHLEGELELDYDEDIIGPRVEVTLGDTPIAIREEPLSPDELPPELQIPPQDYKLATEKAQSELAGSNDASLSDSGELQETPAAGLEAGSEDSTTTLPVDEDPGFVQAAEAEGAPPGIVPTDPEKAAVCR